MIKKCIVGAVLLVGFGGSVLAQEHCNALISEGVKNIREHYDETHTLEYNYSKYCRVELDEQSDSFAAEAEASIFGYGSGSGSGNSNSKRKRVQSWCDENESKFTSDQTKIAKAEEVSRHATTAWNNCQKIAQKGVKVILSSALRHSEVVDLQLDSTLDAKLRLQSIVVEGFSCHVS